MKHKISRTKYDILTDLALSEDSFNNAVALSSDLYEQNDLLLDSLYMLGETTEQRLLDLWHFGRGLKGVVSHQKQILYYIVGKRCYKQGEIKGLTLPPRYAVMTDDQLDALPMADVDTWNIFANLGRSYTTMAEIMNTSPAVILATIERIVKKANANAPA